ncbi:hypothetical protein BJG94_05695 [Rhizobium sp. Td3]|nr:hypothetical protein BJG94_05695 [Rhizobium sp. Td3]
MPCPCAGRRLPWIPFDRFRNFTVAKEAGHNPDLARPSNNTPFNLVHICDKNLKKPKHFLASGHSHPSATTRDCPSKRPCFLFLHCTKSL